jgi:hypothetical protein
MFKKIVLTSILLLTIGVLVFGAINRTQAKTESEVTGRGGPGRGLETGQAYPAQTDSAAVPQNAGNGYQGGGNASASTPGEHLALPAAVPGDLSAEEAAALAYMREEEKLAHDVYTTLFSQWGLPSFQNIANSELTHTEAVKALLDRYGVQDPASSQAGVFADAALQELYNDLIAQGSQSLAEALKVGALVEETDIADLEARLAKTDNADIQQVFNSLKNGSYNHLRAFTSSLKTQTGEIYQAQVLSQEAYQAIIATGTAAGGNGRGGGQRGSGQGGGYRGGQP